MSIPTTVTTDDARIGEPATTGRASLSGRSRTCTYLLEPDVTSLTVASTAPDGRLVQYAIVSGDGISTMRVDTAPLQGVVIDSIGDYAAGRYNFKTSVPGIDFTIGLSSSDLGPFTLLSPGVESQAGNVGATFLSTQFTSVRLVKSGVVARGTYTIPLGQMAVRVYGDRRTAHVQWVALKAVRITVT